ncbi:MAG TPA: hypothetical protein VNW90_25255 [Acetobacteraceae bacterium]|jgi:hypothetical protein|nr:hypothetical protein [Acetobacteraceae bacterium]
MIDRPLVSPLSNGLGSTGLAQASVPVDPNAFSIENSDGSVDVYLEGAGEPPSVEESVASAPFDTNLAEVIPDNLLAQISSDIRYAIDEDKQGRRDWEDALTKGMDLLGIKDELRTTPWPGACGVVHPMIMEASVRFQSKCITRLFPPTGPATAKVVGESNQAKIAQAKRVSDDINFWLTEKMLEYRDETEQLLFAIPVDGSAFKKVYYDPLLKRPVAQYVPANDFLMPYGFPNLETCPRYTHVMKKAYGDIIELQQIGFYRDVTLFRNATLTTDRIEEKVQRLSGIGPSYSRNELLTLWECTTNLAIDGSSKPYVVTIDEASSAVLSIYRNWREGDESHAKVLSWVHYRYVPWKGAYGLGLIHLIGGIGHSTTSILRQLVDAGTLSNLPGGLKSRQLRIKGDNDPIQPGEFRDVDVPAGKILDSIAFLPYKEPSAVLFQLLQMLVEEGKSFASIAELDITTSAQNAPVGTILALIERATEVITAVQARMHIALARELSLIAEIIRDHTPPEYEYDPPGGLGRDIKVADYNELITVTPVSDPAASTMAQRVMQYQAAIQLSSQAPQLYDLPLLHRSCLEVLGIDNSAQIVPDKTAAEPMDPVAENMALVTSKPVKAFEWQNHMAHIQVHQNFLNDPSTKSALGQNPLGPSITQAMWAHLNEHMAYEYRSQIQQKLGTQLPPLGARLPADAENELSGLVQEASSKLLQQNQAEDQQQQQQQQQQDPILEQQKAELQLKQQAQQSKHQIDTAKLQVEQQAVTQKGQLEAAKIESQERQTMLKVTAENTRHHASEIADSHRHHASEHADTLRHIMTQRVEREKHQRNADQAGIDSVLRNLPSEGPETAPAPNEAPPLPPEGV